MYKEWHLVSNSRNKSTLTLHVDIVSSFIKINLNKQIRFSTKLHFKLLGVRIQISNDTCFINMQKKNQILSYCFRHNNFEILIKRVIDLDKAIYHHRLCDTGVGTTPTLMVSITCANNPLKHHWNIPSTRQIIFIIIKKTPIMTIHCSKVNAN